jgi:rhodanese-related sulfurtransferase
MKQILITLLGIMTSLAMGGCYTSSGGVMPYTGGPQTYVSTSTMHKTVRMVDVRNDQEFFVCDIPPGQQLVIQFDEGDGDDPVLRPDRMRYEVMPNDRTMGKLKNTMSVPDGPSRIIHLTVDQTPEFAPDNTKKRHLRTDEVGDRPDWWTAEGGEVPRETGTTIYDGGD